MMPEARIAKCCVAILVQQIGVCVRQCTFLFGEPNLWCEESKRSLLDS